MNIRFNEYDLLELKRDIYRKRINYLKCENGLYTGRREKKKDIKNTIPLTIKYKKICI